MERPSVYERVENGISQLLQGEIDAGQLAGASIAILHKGVEIFSKEYGFADISGSKPIDEGTIFRLYSMSKPVAAVAAMILLERGQIDLYAPISQYLPAAKDMKVSTDQGLIEARSDILVLDLLRMTSGIVYPDADASGICMQTLFHHLDYVVEISTRDIHLIYVRHTRYVIFLSLTPYGFSLWLNAASCSQNCNSAIKYSEGTLYFYSKVHVAWCVDNVDTMTFPMASRCSGSDCDTTLLLLSHPVHCSSAIMNLTNFV